MASIKSNTFVALSRLLTLANALVSEDGENPEYDRGITELVADAAGLSPTDDKVDVAQQIGVKPAAVAAWRGKEVLPPRVVSLERKMQIFVDNKHRYSFSKDTGKWSWHDDYERSPDVSSEHGPFDTFEAMIDDAVDPYITEDDDGK